MSRSHRLADSRGTQRIAIVTGGSGRIGRAIALECARNSMKVIVGYHRNQAGAAETCKMVNREGGTAEAVKADLYSDDQVRALINAATDAFGESASLLINNAAVTRPGRLSEVSEADWTEVLAVDVRGIGFAIRHFVEQHDHRKRGDIVNITSTAGFAPLPRSPHYVAAKGGLIAMTRSLALELAPQIRVNAIAPGFVASTSSKRRNEAALVRQVPLARLVQPSEIARTALFLATADVSITGHTLVVDGGWSLNHGEVFPL